MTDDITRGLALLADEAEPAPVDIDSVIATATTRTRNRAIVTTALVTLAVVGALVVSLGNIRQPPVAVTPTPTVGPAPGTLVPEAPDPKTAPQRKNTMDRELNALLDRILPAGWERSAFTIECDQPFGCSADGTISDEGGAIKLFLNVHDGYSYGSCYRPNCTRTILADGTLVQYRDSVQVDDMTGKKMHYLGVSSVSPGGYGISLSAEWPADRTAPVLSKEKWLEFGTAFTYPTN